MHVYMCRGGTHVPQYTCRSHRTTLWTWFCHSKCIWVLQIVLKLLRFVASVFNLSHLTALFPFL